MVLRLADPWADEVIQTHISFHLAIVARLTCSSLVQHAVAVVTRQDTGEALFVPLPVCGLFLYGPRLKQLI